MILTDDEVDQRLASDLNLINKVKVQITNKHLKGDGDKTIPPMVRSLIGRLSVTGSDTDKEIGSVFGVSQPTVSNSARGLIGDRVDPELKEDVDNGKLKIKDKEKLAHEAALDGLMTSLGRINPLLANPDNPYTLKDLRNTAKDLSSVVASLKKSNEDGPTTNNTLIVLHGSERVRKESHYDIIDA